MVVNNKVTILSVSGIMDPAAHDPPKMTPSSPIILGYIKSCFVKVKKVYFFLLSLSFPVLVPYLPYSSSFRKRDFWCVAILPNIYNNIPTTSRHCLLLWLCRGSWQLIVAGYRWVPSFIQTQLVYGYILGGYPFPTFFVLSFQDTITQDAVEIRSRQRGVLQGCIQFGPAITICATTSRTTTKRLNPKRVFLADGIRIYSVRGLVKRKKRPGQTHPHGWATKNNTRNNDPLDLSCWWREKTWIFEVS